MYPNVFLPIGYKKKKKKCKILCYNNLFSLNPCYYTLRTMNKNNKNNVMISRCSLNKSSCLLLSVGPHDEIEDSRDY